MIETERTPGSPLSAYDVSGFTRELIDDLVQDRYRPRAWRAFGARFWARSLEDIRAEPERMLSFWQWILLGAGFGLGLVGLTYAFYGSGETLRALALWLPWYALTALFVLAHLGMVDDEDGRPHRNLLLPNGLSLMRLGLAPLAMWPCLSAPADLDIGSAYAAFLVILALTDVLDGWLAHRWDLHTRMGRMLDPLADLALLVFLAAGLMQAGLLPAPLFALLMLRYPGALVVALVLYLTRGRAPLSPTMIGRATTFATGFVLLTGAVAFLVEPLWLLSPWMDWSIRGLYVLTVASLLHLIYRALRRN